jgi:transcriptional regulator
MRNNPAFEVTDPEWVKSLIRENPWATLVSSTATGLVASHYPVLLDDAAEGIALWGHVGRPDEELLELGRHELLVIIEGPHGYVSPGWYEAAVAVPTWNFTVAHLYGTPEILSQADNLQALDALVSAFENTFACPHLMRGTPANAAYAEAIVGGTVGFRLEVGRWVAKDKLSPNKPPATVQRVIAGLAAGSPYADPRLASRMMRAHGGAE